MTRFLLVAIAVLWLARSSALAQPSGPVVEAAQNLFSKATAAYNLGRFDEAVELFSKAYEVWPQPEFLYNIAQSYRLARNCKPALHFYKRFRSIKEQDTAAPLSQKKRNEIEKFITELTECVSKAELTAGALPDTIVKPPPTPPAPPATAAAVPSAATASTPANGPGLRVAALAPPAPHPLDERSEPVAAQPSARRQAGLWVGAAGVAVLGVGLVFGAKASSSYSDAKRACGADLRCDPASYDQGNRSISDARSSAALSSALVAAGGAAIVAGAIVFVTARSPRDRTAARLVPLAHDDGAGLALVGGF